ncbi:MAG: pyrrolo-quinoline quinone [Flavobacteriaceae bacterium]|nr:pyrrolo-quinoline quinone [Flavobacteriaceae bacterium]
MKQINLFLVFILLFSCSKKIDRKELNILNQNSEKWNEYLGDKARTHYSSLNQINKFNVKTLIKVWEYKSGDLNGKNTTQIQCSPIVIDSILYGTNPVTKLFAVNAKTGKELWKFDHGQDVGPGWWGVNRGLIYWDDKADGRIIYTSGSYIYAVDALTGKIENTFGENGKIDLRKNLGRPFESLSVVANTPGVIYKNILIQGTRVHEGPGASPGHIRAYDLVTGSLVWRFNTIPQPGEYGYDTWPKDAYKYVGGANSWAGMTLDEETGIVYIPTGSASYDFWGGNRKGENLFANSLIALDASIGKRLWHFQFVHHDLWDRDLPAPPNLVNIKKDGKLIKAVAQVTKSGHVFVFDRKNGNHVFPVKEFPFPKSELEDEESWPTQPLPTKIPPFARQEFTKDMINDMFPNSKALLAWTPNQKEKVSDKTIKEVWETLNSQGQFHPHSETKRSITFPGLDGGAEWGGAAFDPNTGWLYVNSNEMAWVSIANKYDNPKEWEWQLKKDPIKSYGKSIYSQQCSRCHGAGLDGMSNIPGLKNLKNKFNKLELSAIIKKGKGSMMPMPQVSESQIKAMTSYLLDDDTIDLDLNSYRELDPNIVPYSIDYFGRFMDENGYPAVKPPWGTLNAIDLNKGEIVWQVPLGEYEELTNQGFAKTGTENYGGPILTDGGLIFIGATNDEYFRAFDKKTGQEIWKVKLPAGGYATPITYQIEGKQYVVIACGGGKMGTKSGDSYIAFALN